jgi:chorismate mutase
MVFSEQITGVIDVLRGVRGATTVERNDRIEIMEAVSELLFALQSANGIETGDIGAIIFSSTSDVNSAFPAAAARSIGWLDVPLFGTQEIDNPDDGVSRCIRVLVLWNTDLSQQEIRHVYLRGAVILRPDAAK